MERREIKFASSFDDYLVYYDFEKITKQQGKNKDQSETEKQHT